MAKYHLHAAHPFYKRLISLIDLTRLGLPCSDEEVSAVCAHGAKRQVAAICLPWEKVEAARSVLTQRNSPKISAFYTLPEAGELPELPDAADELEVLVSWKAYEKHDARSLLAQLSEIRSLWCDKTMKVVIDATMAPSLRILRELCDRSIDVGADFIVAATSKRERPHAKESLEVFCSASQSVGKQIGIKISGGLQCIEDARQFVNLIESRMGLGWVESQHFRLGCSQLLDDLEGFRDTFTAGTDSPQERWKNTLAAAH